LRAAALVAALLLALAAPAAEPRFSFAGTPGKLPKDVVPKHYVLRIEPAPDNERFTGRAEIEIEVAKPADAIVLNASGLSFDSVRLTGSSGSGTLSPRFNRAQETVTLTPEAGPIAAGAYRLAIDYSGRIGRFPQGFYRIDYKLEEGGRLADKVMLATQMEPVHARKLFPGWDEPAFRATFEVSVVVGGGLTAVSNMPVASQSSLGTDRKEVKFARSVSMPTYLVALFIGEMDRIEDSVDGVALAIYTAKGRAEKARYAMDATKRILRYFREYFDTPYTLPKLDQIALPGGIGGAMENWGAIAYNEGRILLEPAGAPLRQRQGAFTIIAHELAHQWFGNLVTMAWWDNLWLNEGFAQWMQYKAAGRFHPEWGMRERGGLWRQTAMSDDARRTTRPIQTPVENDARAMDIFDAITYSKGEAFIAMLEGYLGEDAFRDGIRRYMKAHAFSNTTTADLWHHLSAASGRDVAAMAGPWTTQPGLPLVHVDNRCENGQAVATLRQERFTLNYPEALKLLWQVPVALLDSAGARTTALLRGGAPQEVRLSRCGPVLANAGYIGYFRVQYDERGFAAIARTLDTLPAPERFRFLADSWALVIAGRLDAGRYLGLVERLGGELDATVWEQTLGTLRFLRELIDDPRVGAAYDRRVVALLRVPFARLGWDSAPGESGERAALRGSLITALGRAGDAEVIAEARARFAARAAKPIDRSIRAAVLNTVGRHADEATHEALVADWRRATQADERWELQNALRQAADWAIARRWMEFALRTNELAPGDAVYQVHRTGADSGHGALVWEFVRANLPAIFARTSPRGRAFVLPDAAQPFADEKIADELIALTQARLPPGARYQAEKTADLIRLKAQVKAREAARIALWAAGG
jgi:aminopeptidase N